MEVFLNFIISYYFFKVIFFTLILNNLESIQISIIDNMAMVMYSLEDCDKPRAPVYYYNSSIVNLGGGRTGFNGNLVIKETTPFTFIKTTLYKCKTKQAPDCEYFLTVTFQDACKFFSSNDDLWSPFMNNSIPRVSCEGKKGIYVYKNAYFDFSKAAQVPVFLENYWRMRTEVFSDKKIAHCEILDFELTHLNKRKNRRN